MQKLSLSVLDIDLSFDATLSESSSKPNLSTDISNASPNVPDSINIDDLNTSFHSDDLTTCDLEVSNSIKTQKKGTTHFIKREQRSHYLGIL